MRATDELFQNCIALVPQILVNADRGSVVGINSHTLNRHKETFLDRLRPALVSADRFEQRYLLLLTRTSEGCGKLQLAHSINGREAAPPQGLNFVWRFVDHQINKAGHSRGP